MAETLHQVIPDPQPDASATRPTLATRGLTVTASARPLLRKIDLAIRTGEVLGIIGPSGAGKSTLLKSLNRLIDLESPPLRLTGRVEYHGHSIYAPGVDPDRLRTRIGMLFQQPVIFPHSIFHNVLFGVRHVERPRRREWPEIVEIALRRASLWQEVKDRLHEPAVQLSAGQQQRLCLARALAVRPEVLLLDEPTSALDPRSTEAIEELIRSLKANHAVVLVTHNPAQARRVTDRLACICMHDGAGELLADGPTPEVISSQHCYTTIDDLEQEVRLVR